MTSSWVIKQQPDMTLDQIVAAMAKAKIRAAALRCGVSWIGGITLKRLFTRKSKSAPRSPARGDVGNENGACLIPQN
jgi:hypothetical protein